MTMMAPDELIDADNDGIFDNVKLPTTLLANFKRQLQIVDSDFGFL
jgi:hypothetical protein